LLKTDHRRVDELFSKVKVNEDGNNKDVFTRIKEELDLHAHIEEQIFYPHLLENGDEELQKIVREGIEEHAQVKTLLPEIAALDGDSDDFKAKLKVLMENVEHHVDEEENEMFPMVRDQIDEQMRVRIGSLLEAEKARMGGESARSASAS
jgi:iron-sulfur cluster repair protein YtfE (RIC family)